MLATQLSNMFNSVQLIDYLKTAKEVRAKGNSPSHLMYLFRDSSMISISKVDYKVEIAI